MHAGRETRLLGGLPVQSFCVYRNNISCKIHPKIIFIHLNPIFLSFPVLFTFSCFFSKNPRLYLKCIAPYPDIHHLSNQTQDLANCSFFFFRINIFFLWGGRLKLEHCKSCRLAFLSATDVGITYLESSTLWKSQKWFWN